MFCCWSSLEALVVLGQVLRYVGGFPDPMVSSVVLCIIAVFLKIWYGRVTPVTSYRGSSAGP